VLHLTWFSAGKEEYRADMSENVQAARSPSGLKKWAIVVTAIAALFALAILIDVKVRFENLDRVTFRNRAGVDILERERLDRFTSPYPTYNGIKEYLSDATILISHPPSNVVYYFDDRSNYIHWHDNEIRFGVWSSSPYVAIMVLETKWRITIVNSYCGWLLDEPEYAQQDNCTIVRSLDRMFRYSGSYSEYRRGNVFKLSKGSPPRLSMPTANISIDELVAAMASGDLKK